MRVLSGALRVLVRREVSLNRRLYFLLLGVSPSDPNASSPSDQRAYFAEFARTRTLRALSHSFERATTLSASALAVQPFKVLVGLLERAEIGEALVADTLPHVLRAMQHALTLIDTNPTPARLGSSTLSISADYADTLSAARAVLAESLALLEALRAELVWARLVELGQSALEDEHALPLLAMALTHLVPADSQRVHLARLLAALLRRCHAHTAHLTHLADALRVGPLLTLALRVTARLGDALDSAATPTVEVDVLEALTHLQATFVTVPFPHPLIHSRTFDLHYAALGLALGLGVAA